MSLKKIFFAEKIPSAIYLLLTIVIVFNLFYLGTKPFAVGLFPSPWDKVAHFITFSIIALLLWLTFNGRWPLLAVILTTSVGALDEFHQAHLVGRSADIKDFGLDLLAAMTTIALLHYLKKKYRST